MKKIVFTLSAITAVCACGLVIDPDKLTEGNGTNTAETSTPDTGGDGTTPPQDSGSDVIIDAPTDGPTLVEIPECVPAAPANTKGPYAVTFVNAPGTAVCPAGYLATPVESAKGNLVAENIVCGSMTGCSCSSPSGTPTCGLRLQYYNDNACTTAQGSDTITANCRDIDSFNYLKVVKTVTGVTCSNTGPVSIAPTVKPTPSFKESWVICQPDPNVQLAQCKSDQVGVPPAKDAGACVITTAETCPAPYTQDIRLSKSGTFTDGRACACSCGAPSSSCSGGSATIYSEDTCTGGTNQLFELEACKPRNGDDGMTGVLPTPGAAACEAKVSPTGSFEPSNDLHICCLP